MTLTGTNTIRSVKRQGTGEDLNKNFVKNYKWVWKHESGQFRPYEDDANFLIEQSYIDWKNSSSKNETTLIQGTSGYTYQIVYSNMTQYNEVTRFARPIKRENI